MAFAYCQKLARINLTTGAITTQTLEAGLLRQFIGGRGLGTKILRDEGCAEVDALSPENQLIFSTGPLTGTDIPLSSRYAVVTKSPLSGKLACANSGGIWGRKLKHAGWDALIVEGEAPQWTYINITDDQIELLDASGCLGLFTGELDDRLKELHGKDASTLSIGIAGENKVLLSAIMNDKTRAAGRSGIGAVMGSKKLKAIVVTASGKNADHSVEALKSACEEVLEQVSRNRPESSSVQEGTCHRCPIACGRKARMGGKDRTGGNIPPAVMEEVNTLCDAYGMDAFSVPATIAAAMELYQRGAIREEDCGTLSLKYDNAHAFIEWSKRMANPKTELERLMSSGADRLCRHYSVTLQKEHTSPGKKDKPSRVLSAVIDSMGLCLFTSTTLGAPEYTKLLNAAWGTQYTPEEILQVGEDICHLERAFNELSVSHSGTPAI